MVCIQERGSYFFKYSARVLAQGSHTMSVSLQPFFLVAPFASPLRCVPAFASRDVYSSMI